MAEKRGVRIETSGETTLGIGSRALLLQLSTNLVHNAIVHNLPDHGIVWVSTSARTDVVELVVENTGETLAPEMVSTLAEPFLRGGKRVRTDHAGVGLGLTIAKSIAHAHEGTLTLTPREAGGVRLRVTVRLPPDGSGAAAFRLCTQSKNFHSGGGAGGLALAKWVGKSIGLRG